MIVLTEEKRAETIMAKAHADRLYVFDLFGNGTLVASRAPEEHSLRSENIQDYVTPATWQEVRAHLLSYSPLPLVIDSCLGAAIVIPSLAPTASLGVLCVSSIPRDRLIRLAKSGECGEMAMASSTADIRLRMGKRTTALSPAFQAWMTEVTESLCGLSLPSVTAPCTPIHPLLHDRMQSMASYVGIPISFDSCGEIMNVGDFDLPLFVALFLLSLCLARRVSLDRSVNVSLQTTGFGSTCRVAMHVPDTLCAEQQQELITMRAIAERKNMPLDTVQDGARLCVRFSATAKEWSYLELKSPDLFVPLA